MLLETVLCSLRFSLVSFLWEKVVFYNFYKVNCVNLRRIHDRAETLDLVQQQSLLKVEMLWRDARGNCKLFLTNHEWFYTQISAAWVEVYSECNINIWDVYCCSHLITNDHKTNISFNKHIRKLTVSRLSTGCSKKFSFIYITTPIL